MEFAAALPRRPRQPEVAEARSITTIRDAVLWLRDAACQHLPDAEFAKIRRLWRAAANV
jgi:hypothetical protein